MVLEMFEGCLEGLSMVNDDLGGLSGEEHGLIESGIRFIYTFSM